MQDPLSLIKVQFDHAWNAADLDRVMDCFAPDAVVRPIPPLPGGPDHYRGKDQIRTFVASLIDGFHVDPTHFLVEDDTVRWYAVISNDGFREMGIDTLDNFCEAVVRDGKIVSFAPTFTPASLAKLQAAQHRALAHRFYDEVVSGGAVDLIDELFAPDFVDHEVFPGVTPDRAGVRQFVEQFRTAFPDTRWTVEDLLTDGDRMAARVRIRGTHRGTFLDIPATGRQIDFTTMDFIRFAGDRVVEHWGVTDTMTLMQQLGTIPEDASPA